MAPSPGPTRFVSPQFTPSRQIIPLDPPQLQKSGSEEFVVMLYCRLVELFPALANVEYKTLIYPHFTQLDMLFGNVTYNWSQQYSCHVWRRFGGRVPMSPRDILRLNSTLGQMMRLIYNGPR